MVDRKQVEALLNEELSKGDVRSMISSALDSHLNDRDFKRAVKNIVADTVEEFLDSIWKRKSYWKGTIKRN